MLKRVIFVLTNLNGGGAERVVLRLLKNLDKTKFDITLFLLEKSGVYWDEVPNDIKLIIASSHKVLPKWQLPFVLKKLANELNNQDLVIGAIELMPTYLAYLAAKIKKKPIIGWVHIDLVEYLKTRSNWHKIAVSIIYPRLDKIIVPADNAKNSLCFLIKNHIHIEVINNPIDNHFVKEKAKDIFPDWAIDIFKRPVIIAIGRLSRQKRFDILLKAHAKVNKDHHMTNLLILGEGKERKKLEELIQELNIHSSVFLPGFVNPFPLLKKAYVLVSCSDFEGFGMTIIEAMSLDVPVIATNCPSGPEEILQDRFGILIPTNDIDALAESIKKLLNDNDLRHKLSVLAQQRAQDFAIEKIIPIWEKLLLEKFV